MILKMIAIRDVKAGIYKRISHTRSTHDAIRGWEQVVQQKDSEFAAFPNDFELVELGITDDESGKTVCHERPIQLGFAKDFMKPDTQLPLPLKGVV